MSAPVGAVFKSAAARADIHARYRDLLAFWPVPSEHLRLPTSQGETFVVACGAKDAPPLILLHGAMSLAASWMGDAAVWSRRFRVYAIDMIGEPGFSAPARPPLGDEAYAIWLDDVMDGLGLKTAAFVGMSLGGWLALDYLHRRPERVERLVLLCPAGIGRQRLFRLRAVVRAVFGPWGLRRIRQMVFGAPPGDLPPTVRALMALTDDIARVFRPRTERIPILDDAALGALSAPMLVILGGRDVTIDSFDTRRRLAAHAPRAIVRFLPEARHHIPGQTEAILAFLLSETE